MHKFDKKMQSIIKKERLDDPSILFSDYETFEEIPLFSRWSHIYFLKNMPFDSNNKFLIKHAIRLSDHAMEIACAKKNPDLDDFFCCVTLTNWDYVDEINCITPNIYVTKRASWLFSYVKLKKTMSEEEVLITNYINEIGLIGYSTYVSGASVDVSRVYIVKDKFIPIINL